MAGEDPQAITMKGGGYYSLATKGAKDVIDGATPLVLKALQEMDLRADPTPFSMSDMGCADAGTSISMVEAVLAEVRAASPGRHLSIIYCDQPRNDYNALFRNIHGLGVIDTKLGEMERLSILASATSFYNQILPGGSLDLGFSATAMHWLSRKPGDISDHIHSTGARGAELAAFRDQAKKDWEGILLCRAKELKPGGRLVF
ncbi:MAG: hypothetical protein R3245_03230, partial [Kiloniellales bacterium]|nr:hypothetical protein [Kiloniellales bacterium]